MAYIYQITNKINGKIYIGKTEFSLEKRFKEHCKDAFKKTAEKRPLYAAMRKYETENFQIELIEETDIPEERERFWIEEKGSFKNGYNATKGGDGKAYIDYNLIVKVYEQVHSVIETSKIVGCDKATVSKVLHAKGYDLRKNRYIFNSSPVVMCDKESGESLKVFNSASEAVRYLKGDSIKRVKGGEVSHIRDACKGLRKTAYGYKWKKL